MKIFMFVAVFLVCATVSYSRSLPRRQNGLKESDDSLIDCGPLTAPPNCELELTDGSNKGSFAVYNCMEGYERVGTSLRNCLPDSTWSQEAPTCQEVGPKADCGPLEDPENGKVNMDQGTLAGSYAIYVCDPGYKLVGFLDFRVCQHDGFWSDTKIRCEPIVVTVECDLLPNPVNGLVSVDTTAAGGVATYSCDEGFVLSGAEVRTCGEDGEWSDDEPFCNGIGAVCGSLPHPANGRVELDGTDVGSIATYYCDDLFELVGDDTRVCREDGTYSGAEPVCEQCANGALRLVGGSTEYEGRVEMCKDGRFGTVCDAGFGNSDAKVVCKELGHRLRGAVPHTGAYFGEGAQESPIHLTEVGCRGWEVRLLKCPAEEDTSACTHANDAGVTCTPRKW